MTQDVSKVGAICYKYEIPCAIEKYEITIGLAEEDLEETIKDKKKTNGIYRLLIDSLLFIIISYQHFTSSVARYIVINWKVNLKILQKL